jgi:WD40 repeat protein
MTESKALIIATTALVAAVAATFLLLPNGLLGAALSPDTWSSDARVLLMGGQVNAVRFRPDGSQLAVLSNFGSSLSIYSVDGLEKTGQLHRFGGGYSENSLALLPDGSAIMTTPVGQYGDDSRYAGTALVDNRFKHVDNFALVQQDITGRYIRYFPDLADNVAGIFSALTFAASDDGAFVAGINRTGVLIFDGHTGHLLRTLEMPDRASLAMSVAISANNKLAVGTINGAVREYDLASGNLERSFIAYPGGDYMANALVFSPDGKRIATGRHRNFDGRLKNGVWVTRQHTLKEVELWTLEGTQLASLNGPPTKPGGDDAPSVWALAWSPDGGRLAIADEMGLRMWDLSKDKATLSLSKMVRGGGSFSVAFSKRGVLAAAMGSEVYIYR